MLRRYFGIALCAGCLCTIFGQNTTLDTPTLNILFLTQHAQDVRLRTGGHGKVTAADWASRFHVQLNDMQAIDAAATLFVAQDGALSKEALQKHRAAKAAGSDLSRDAVHSFTLRRIALVNAAIASLQSQLTPQSYAALQLYVDSEFRNSIKIIR